MDGADSEASFRQILGQTRGSPLGFYENDGPFATLCLQNPGEDLHLVHRVRAVGELGDVFHRLPVIFWFAGPNVCRLVHEAAGQSNNRAGHGR